MFELTVEREHKYLNVLVWYRIKVESIKEEDEIEQQTKDLLLGYVSSIKQILWRRCWFEIN